ncbi:MULTISPECIES: hypothetical protein [unclassified Dietzia]|uniref:hypothetical protein n=1 Tax=unclassified Dietzia TaxID=2617939 RepID=UPI0015F97FB0|nr:MULTISPECIES: hypothetical protein [unclassified Dietzia]MBB1041191.1 hypothetical protein [Dietzia sp. Cai40]MBB1042983.1 hypothetical protein [Dietzia sp. DQ11-44]
MDNSSIPAPPPVNGDFITHFRREITAGTQSITVEVSTFIDNGVEQPPTLYVSGDIDLNLDQLSDLNEALFRAQYAQMHARRAQLEAQR